MVYLHLNSQVYVCVYVTVCVDQAPGLSGSRRHRSVFSSG